MKTARKLISVLLVVCILTAGVGAFAAGAAPQGGVALRWQNIDALGAGLTFGTLGKANCTGSLELSNMDDTGTLYMYLQRAVNGQWEDVYSWSTSGSIYVSLGKTFYVTSGYYYRVHVVGYVYSSSGQFKEVGSQESLTVYY